MNKTINHIFKATISPELLSFLQDSPIGKHIATMTTLTVHSILEYCSLEVPRVNCPGTGWTVSWDTDVFPINPKYFKEVEILLKQAWLFGSNECDNSLYRTVSEDLNNFELTNKVVSSWRQKKIAAKSKRIRIHALHDWIMEVLIENPKIQTKQIWAMLPEGSKCNEEGFYRDGDTICCLQNAKHTLGWRAFYKKVASIRKIIELSDASCNSV